MSQLQLQLDKTGSTDPTNDQLERRNELRQKLGPAPLSEIEERKCNKMSMETINQPNSANSIQDFLLENYPVENREVSLSESEDIYWLIEQNEQDMKTDPDWTYYQQSNKILFNLNSLGLCDHSLSNIDVNEDSIIIENKNDIINNNQIESKSNNQQISSETKSVFRTFEHNEFKQAKQALIAGQQIKYKLPTDLTSQQLLHMASSLGIDTAKLRKTLTSSMTVKKIIDDYVSVYKNEQRFSYTQVDYLKFVTQVIPLTCDKNMNPQIQIRMDLEYYKYAVADLRFKRHFINQLAVNVFRCPVNNITISDVYKGSIIVVLAIGIITLAHVGVIALCVHFGSETRQNPAGIDKRNARRDLDQEFELKQKVKVYGKYMATVVGKEIVGEKVIIKIRYDGARPHYIWNKYEFESDDYGIEPLDAVVNGTIHICPAGGCIFASPDCFRNMEQAVAK
eukprot:52200_1